jgi:hypothetical protein
MWLKAKGDAMMPLTTTYSSIVTIVYRPWPWTVSTLDTSSMPDTVMMQSPTATDEAYTSGRGEVDLQAPAGKMWLWVILMSLPCVVVMCVKTVLSAFDAWGTNTTSEKTVSREASAASTLSPALTSEIGFISPDWSVTLSEPAKQDFNKEEADEEEEEDDGISVENLTLALRSLEYKQNVFLVYIWAIWIAFSALRIKVIRVRNWRSCGKGRRHHKLKYVVFVCHALAV